MRTVILIITTFLCTTTLCAQVQQPVQWEYAELDVISGAPALWTAGDSVRLQGALAQPGPVRLPDDAHAARVQLFGFLNAQGAEGWEAVSRATSGPATITYFFKRRRR